MKYKLINGEELTTVQVLHESGKLVAININRLYVTETKETYFSSSILAEKINFKRNIVNHTDILFRIHRYFNILVVDQLGAHTLKHVASHLMSFHSIKRSVR